MEPQASPLVFDRPVPPEDLVGRDAELAVLADRARRGRFTLLYGPRRYVDPFYATWIRESAPEGTPGGARAGRGPGRGGAGGGPRCRSGGGRRLRGGVQGPGARALDALRQPRAAPGREGARRPGRGAGPGGVARRGHHRPPRRRQPPPPRRHPPRRPGRRAPPGRRARGRAGDPERMGPPLSCTAASSSGGSSRRERARRAERGGLGGVAGAEGRPPGWAVKRVAFEALGKTALRDDADPLTPGSV